MPSGKKWAKCNLGANVPEAAGLYFSWGNTDGHPRGEGYNFSPEVYAQTPGAALTTDMPLENDAAHIMLGDGCHLPSTGDLAELRENTTQTWTSINGVFGRMFVSNINGRSIFIPAAGRYEGTVLAARNNGGYYFLTKRDSETNANDLYFTSSVISTGSSERRYGFPLRAVKEH